jgi:hypothetical protein
MEVGMEGTTVLEVGLCYSNGVCGALALELPVSLLERQDLRLLPTPTESESAYYQDLQVICLHIKL